MKANVRENAAIKTAAFKFVFSVENGSFDAYDSISPNFDGEGLSLGLIQFNLGGDAQTTFGLINKNVFMKFMPKWGQTFWQAIHNPNARKAIFLSLQLQTKTENGWRVKPDALVELRNFLASPESKAAQDVKVNDIYDSALSRASQWALANGRDAPNGREITTFVDNQVFSGGAMNGVWLIQAKAFRSSFKDDGSMVAFVGHWLKSCPISGPDMLYGGAELGEDASAWENALPPGNNLPVDRAMLFALGFVRGLAAVGPPDDQSKRGIFKAQVIVRRGVIALGVGTANGVNWPGGLLNGSPK